ncbi:MAG TPA: ABC-F family ATP-binding cassette domain-containing protein [Treponemataceae bacterium]|nr:ABC-F family ATP-binding cassette domain-containing protein [Treponemataceae bacterium]
MNYLSVKNLTKIGREAPLFENITFGLDDTDKVALIGQNGTGKSTLLNCIAGIVTPDSGSVVMNKSEVEHGSLFSFLPQIPAYTPSNTIREHIFSSESPKLDIIRKYEQVCHAIAGASKQAANDRSADNKKSLLQNETRLNALTQIMNEKDLWTYESEVASILNTLGITDLDQKMQELSGGMKKKVALAQVLVEDSKLLLLDEPTNHLDISTISWLQDYLVNTKRAVFMVTHDRYFLDAVCNHIYELENKSISLYDGNYSAYLEKKEIENQIAQNTDRRIESVLRVEREWLLRAPCARAGKSRSRIRKIHGMMAHEKFKKQKKFEFEVAGRRLGGKVLELQNISKFYPKGNRVNTDAKDIPVIKDFSFTFNKGDKIGVYGDNGSGKSTLLNIISNKIKPDSGELVFGTNTQIAYYEQNPTFKDLHLSVLEYIKEIAENITLHDGTIISAARMLERFNFEGKIQHSPLLSLSGGERKRVYLVRLLMSNPNFLILDEPTNDFDIFTMGVLEDFLTNYKGCLLIVSHDRFFMDKIAETLFILENDGSISGYVGKCSEYLEYKNNQDRKKTQATKEKRNEKNTQTTPHTTNSTPRRRTFKEEKEFEHLEEAIFSAEDRKEELEKHMGGGETNPSKLATYSKEYAQLISDLELQYSRWEELGTLTTY